MIRKTFYFEKSEFLKLALLLTFSIGNGQTAGKTLPVLQEMWVSNVTAWPESFNIQYFGAEVLS